MPAVRGTKSATARQLVPKTKRGESKRQSPRHAPATPSGRRQALAAPRPPPLPPRPASRQSWGPSRVLRDGQLLGNAIPGSRRRGLRCRGARFCRALARVRRRRRQRAPFLPRGRPLQRGRRQRKRLQHRPRAAGRQPRTTPPKLLRREPQQRARLR
ncbi:uncharacterized protein Tco025E_09613 [Trypanosoma conorhini]|uniref:Uncharacterized protein n=1 Tax=Trypanosoma conorhini TaxID=83891 RepID=A0A422MUG5_9TRYP|nr:uncharacterized protein Tco025E_09613 [Trypanosoma conorhini]RNE96882.1 hypothetical protein Tco025E_09613 [Trypanosoma conorhini]